MATLGEAFISVRADMKPFRRDLKNEVQKAADDVEKALGKAVEKGITSTAKSAGQKAGDDAGDGIAQGIKRKTGDKSKEPWVAFVGAFAGALDDGISALPTELKAAIVLGLIAVSPLIIGGLSGAIAAGIAAGVAGLGIVLGAQFTSVQDRWMELNTFMRNTLIVTARSFEPVLLNVFDIFEGRLRDLDPKLTQLFDKASTFVIPLTEALFDALEFIIDSLNISLGESDVFIEELAKSFAVLGSAIGDAFEVLASTGEDGAMALRDLVFIIASLILDFASLFATITKVYGAIRRFVNDTPAWVDAFLIFAGAFELFTDAADTAAGGAEDYNVIQGHLSNSTQGVIDKTKAEEKALKDLEKAIEEAREAAFESVQVNIDWERSLDRLREGFQENGKTIKVETEEGRKNLENLGKAIRDAQERAQERFNTGKLNAEQARAFYNAEINDIYKIAESFGISRKAVDEYYASAIAAVSLPPPSIAWSATLANNAERAYQALRAAWNLGNRQGGPQPFADGGIVYGPTNALIGEAGAEAVIPMTRPQRAADLMRQSGLDRLVAGNNNISVQVFVGNEQLDARTVRIVQQSNSRQAQLLSYGVRG